MSSAASPAEGHGGSPSIGVEDYWWYLARAELLETTLGRYADRVTSVLDIGSADGPSAAWFTASAPHAVSLDIDPRGLIGARAGVCGSALELPFADAAFDVVSAFDVIEHCEPEAQALAQVRRVLRPGGRFLMAVPAYQWAWTDHDVANGHYRRYTRARAVRAVQAAGFRVDRASHAFAAVFPMFAAERLYRRARGSRVQGALDIAAVPAVPRPVHHALMALCTVDNALLRRWDLPFGSSVFVAATKT